MMIMKKDKLLKIMIASFFITSYTFSNSKGVQEIRPEILSIIDSLLVENCVRLYLPDFFDSYQKKVSIEELKILIHHTEPVIRVYSYWALSNKNYDKAYNILLANINNRHFVNYCSDEYDDPYIEYEGWLYYIIWKSYTEAKEPTTKQRRVIDSLIIHEKTSIPFREALINFQPYKSHYCRIREFAMRKDSIPLSIVALAKYHCRDDIPLIFKYINNEETKSYGVAAVAEFPDTSFYNSILTSLSEEVNNRWIDYGLVRGLYEALVQYPDKRTVDFLIKVRKKTHFFKRKAHDEALWNALEKHPNEIFNPLKSKLKGPYDE